MTEQRWTGTVEYVRAKITDKTSEQIDAPSVSMALTAPDVAPSAWLSATWLTDAGTSRTCGVMAGPGQAFVPAAGDYMVWWKFTDSPEVPAQRAGLIRFFD